MTPSDCGVMEQLKARYVVVGGGIAAVSCVQEVRVENLLYT